MSTRIDATGPIARLSPTGNAASATSSGINAQKGRGWEATIAAPEDRTSFLLGRHSIRVDELAQLRDVLNNTNDPSFASGGGYVQQQAEAIATYKAMLRSLIAHDQGESAAKLFDAHPIGQIKRYLEGTSLCLPWLRLRNIDPELREWADSRYAAHPELRQEKALQIAPKKVDPPAPATPSFPAGPMLRVTTGVVQSGPFIVKRTEDIGQDGESRDYYVAVQKVQPGEIVYRGLFRYIHEIDDSRGETRMAPMDPTQIRAEIYGAMKF